MEQSLLLNHPNQVRNRIPLPSERETLRSALQTKLDIEYKLSNLIKSIEAIQHELKMHGESLLEELESNVSGISAMNECKAAAMAQKRSLELSINELRGLLHPIRSCPDDILWEIFQIIVKDSPISESMPKSVTLSHVCQRWRNLTLGTPSLWCKIPIRLRTELYEEQNQRLPEFWESILPRLRNCPAKIYLDVADEDVAEDDLPADGKISHLVPLSKIANLHTVHLLLYGAGACNAGINLFKELTRPVKYVRLTLASRGVYNLSPILSRAGRLKLVVQNQGTEVTKHQEQYDNLKSLYLSLPTRFNVSNILQSCLNLKRLRITPHEFDEFEDLTLESTAYTFPNLQHLNVYSACILNNILNPLSTCPKLEQFKHWSRCGTLFYDFVRRHPWITSLSIDSLEDLLMVLDVLPNLTSLATGWDSRCIKIFYLWEECGISQCPFPKMETLTLCILSSGDIQQILNRRAEGPGFRPLYAQGVVPLRVFGFKQNHGSDTGWLENPTLEFAKVVHVQDNEYPDLFIYTISWPRDTERN